MPNKVYIATSIDGFIADKNGSIEWLSIVPHTTELQTLFDNLLDSVDALVMGKNTFQTIVDFNQWPYTKKVFVLSNSMKDVPDAYVDKVELIQGSPKEVTRSLDARGYTNLYIDGGATIQSFLKDELIDELIISTIPILLGGGKPLFSKLNNNQLFKHVDTKVYSNILVQSHYIKSDVNSIIKED